MTTELKTTLAPDITRPEKEQTEIESSVSVASQWQLMWWKFRRHKLALVCGVVVILLYVVALFVEFIAPYPPNAQDATKVYHPPTAIHLRDAGGDFHLPFVSGTSRVKSTGSV